MVQLFGDDTAARNQPAHLPRRAGSARPVAPPWSPADASRPIPRARRGARRLWPWLRTGQGNRPTRAPELGSPHAQTLRHRRAGVSKLWGPPAPDRHHPRSCRHSGDPRSPGPLPVGAESGPRPTRAHRRGALNSSVRGAADAVVPSVPAQRHGARSALVRLAHLPLDRDAVLWRSAEPGLSARVEALVCAVPTARGAGGESAQLTSSSRGPRGSRRGDRLPVSFVLPMLTTPQPRAGRQKRTEISS
jgi:hypothetical protein